MDLGLKFPAFTIYDAILVKRSDVPKMCKIPRGGSANQFTARNKKSVYFAAEQKVSKEGKSTNKDMAKDKKVWEC